MSPKVITVFGATGKQGGSVVSTILSHPDLASKYTVRAVTRDTTKASAKALAAKGCEVVAADLNQPDTVRAAVDGAYAVYGVTNYWEHSDKALEIRQGRAIADASFAAGVKHLVWSSLPHAIKITGGKLTEVEHFDSKAEVEEYIEQHKKKHGTAASYYLPAFFMSNIPAFIRRDAKDGVAVYASMIPPTGVRMAMVDIEADTGKFVLGLLEAGPEAADGARVNGVSEWGELGAYIAQMGEELGEEVRYQHVSREATKENFPAATAEEMAQNFDLIIDYSYYGNDEEAKQPASDRFLLQGTKKVGWREYVKNNGPWKW